MSINVTQANKQARQLREQAARLRSTQSTLITHQRNLNTHWRGIEMTPINQVIEQNGRSLIAAASQLDSISNDIVRAAEEIKREEEAAARALNTTI